MSDLYVNVSIRLSTEDFEGPYHAGGRETVPYMLEVKLHITKLEGLLRWRQVRGPEGRIDERIPGNGYCIQEGQDLVIYDVPGNAWQTRSRWKKVMTLGGLILQRETNSGVATFDYFERSYELRNLIQWIERHGSPKSWTDVQGNLRQPDYSKLRWDGRGFWQVESTTFQPPSGYLFSKWLYSTSASAGGGVAVAGSIGEFKLISPDGTEHMYAYTGVGGGLVGKGGGGGLEEFPSFGGVVVKSPIRFGKDEEPTAKDFEGMTIFGDAAAMFGTGWSGMAMALGCNSTRGPAGGVAFHGMPVGGGGGVAGYGGGVKLIY